MRIFILLSILLIGSCTFILSSDSIPSWDEYTPPVNEFFKDFLVAIDADDFIAVKQYLEKGMTLNWKTKSGLTPLMVACRCGHLSIYNFLKSNGAGLYGKELFQACEGGNIEIIKDLINAGQNILSVSQQERPGSLNRSPLLILIKNGHIDALRYILSLDTIKKQLKYTSNIFSSIQRSPISDKKKSEMMKAFIEIGTLIDYKDDGELHTLFRIANETNNNDLLFMFFDKMVDVGSYNILNMSYGYSRWTLLHYAARMNNGAAARKLLEMDAKGTIQNRERKTPYDVALGMNNWNAIKVFIEYGESCPLNKHKNFRIDSLFTAIAFGDIKKVKSIQKKALAEKYNPGKTKEELIEKFYCKQNFEFTGLMIAVQTGNVEMIQLLSKNNPYIDFIPQSNSSFKKSALMLAVEKNDASAIEILIKNGAKPANIKKILNYPISNPEVVRLLIEGGADFEFEYAGHTPLGLAIINNNINIVKILIEKGARVTENNILLAVEYGNTDIFSLVFNNSNIIDSCLTKKISEKIQQTHYIESKQKQEFLRAILEKELFSVRDAEVLENVLIKIKMKDYLVNTICSVDGFIDL